ncbi:nuclear transport factor 2 family protein [Hymenobacter lapidiphilus]|uniref:Nuclear transport factor 2 family protein n=1 Tax=Hymenobacter lapidiphilus TaxID=2608003 RepID=A0A7Y7PQP1_9BACT|nr:nuclear transport factor 2 family protein [Hymenobacter lapidiphilus]NVO32275.1 nuclear transport factor 2 family protein [Hymenobacter lapidiphilus]
MSQNPAIETARRALRLLAAIHQGGPVEPYLDLLADDFVFYMPVGPFKGRNVGRERAGECYRQIAASEPNIAYEEPYRTTASGETVVFEFEDGGTLFGSVPYHNRIAASFDVRGGQIAAYREYFGEIDVPLMASMAQSG